MSNTHDVEHTVKLSRAPAPVKLRVSSMKAFNAAADRGDFARATNVWLDTLPLVTALPDMTVDTNVRLDNLPNVPQADRKAALKTGREWIF